MSAETPQLDWYPPKWNAADIPPHLLMSGPPPEAQPPTGLEPNDIFNRLNWFILDPPSDVQIFGPDGQGFLQWQLLSDPSNSLLFDVAATDPPQSRLHVSIELLNSW
jgi:hypothetical protein